MSYLALPYFTIPYIVLPVRYSFFRVKGPSVVLASGQTDQLVQLSCAQDASSVVDCSCPHNHPSFHHLLPASAPGTAVKCVDVPTMLSNAPPVRLHRSLAPPHEDLTGAPIVQGTDCPYSLLRLSQRPFTDCFCRHPVREPRGNLATTDWDQRLAGQPPTAPKDRYRTLGAAGGLCSDVETERLVAEGCPECSAMKAELQNVL